MPSTVIRRFHYERQRQTLIVEFVSGRRYAYHDVPPHVHDAMRAAHSRGSYFNAHVRDHYAFERLDRG